MVLEIRREYAEGRMSQPDLARKYGIGPGQIGKIVRGEAWMDVTAGEPVVTDQGAELRMLTSGIAPMNQRELNESAQRLFEMQEAMRKEQGEVTPRTDPLAAHMAKVGDPFRGLLKLSEEELQAHTQAKERELQQERDKLAAERAEHEKATAPPPPSTNTDLGTHEAREVGAINATQLLETLKDENRST